MTSPVLTVISLSLATGSASFMICSTEISKAPRVWIAKRSGNAFFSWLSRLLGCPYCTGTWLSASATAIWRPLPVQGFPPLDYLVTLFAMNGLAMLAVLIIRKALGK